MILKKLDIICKQTAREVVAWVVGEYGGNVWLCLFVCLTFFVVWPDKTAPGLKYGRQGALCAGGLALVMEETKPLAYLDS